MCDDIIKELEKDYEKRIDKYPKEWREFIRKFDKVIYKKMKNDLDHE